LSVPCLNPRDLRTIPGTRARGPAARKCRFAGISATQATRIYCLPCRRSRVRIPSAAFPEGARFHPERPPCWIPSGDVRGYRIASESVKACCFRAGRRRGRLQELSEPALGGGGTGRGSSQCRRCAANRSTKAPREGHGPREAWNLMKASLSAQHRWCGLPGVAPLRAQQAPARGRRSGPPGRHAVRCR
jgi:hypothetical protein